jgi:hypothetical protein
MFNLTVEFAGELLAPLPRTKSTKQKGKKNTPPARGSRRRGVGPRRATRADLLFKSTFGRAPRAVYGTAPLQPSSTRRVPEASARATTLVRYALLVIVVVSVVVIVVSVVVIVVLSLLLLVVVVVVVVLAVVAVLMVV